MKKVYTFVITFMLLFVLGINNVEANTDSIAICSYKGTATGIFGGTSDVSIYIYYNTKSDSFFVQAGDLTAYYFTDGNLYFEDEVYSNLKKLECPAYAYKDIKLDNEVCLANSETWCKLQGKDTDSTTTFSGTSTQSQNFSEEVTAYLKKFSYIGVMLLPDIENLGDGEQLKENIKAEMNNYISDNVPWMKAVTSPENLLARIETSEVYKAKLEEEYAKVIDSAESLVENAKDNIMNDPDMTDEEKEVELSKLNSYTEKVNNLKEYFEELKNEGLDVTISTADATCDGYLGDGSEGTPKYYLDFVFNLIKYVGVVLLLVLTIVDFAKAVVSNVDDAIKKASKNAIKRVIIVVILFVLPILIDFVLKILGLTSGTCGIG